MIQTPPKARPSRSPLGEIRALRVMATQQKNEAVSKRFQPFFSWRRNKPKANREGNTTLFDIEISITNANTEKLRAGYSVNAEIIIDKADNVLTIPERLIIYSNDMTYVEIVKNLAENTTEIRKIETALSDGMNTQVKEGVKEGELIIERPPKLLK